MQFMKNIFFIITMLGVNIASAKRGSAAMRPSSPAPLQRQIPAQVQPAITPPVITPGRQTPAANTFQFYLDQVKNWQGAVINNDGTFDQNFIDFVTKTNLVPVFKIDLLEAGRNLHLSLSGNNENDLKKIKQSQEIIDNIFTQLAMQFRLQQQPQPQPQRQPQQQLLITDDKLTTQIEQNLRAVFNADRKYWLELRDALFTTNGAYTLNWTSDADTWIGNITASIKHEYPQASKKQIESAIWLAIINQVGGYNATLAPGTPEALAAKISKFIDVYWKFQPQSPQQSQPPFEPPIFVDNNDKNAIAQKPVTKQTIPAVKKPENTAQESASNLVIITKPQLISQLFNTTLQDLNNEYILIIARDLLQMHPELKAMDWQNTSDMILKEITHIIGDLSPERRAFVRKSIIKNWKKLIE